MKLQNCIYSALQGKMKKWILSLKFVSLICSEKNLSKNREREGKLE